jgi:hypothetical protein
VALLEGQGRPAAVKPSQGGGGGMVGKVPFVLFKGIQGGGG